MVALSRQRAILPDSRVIPAGKHETVQEKDATDGLIILGTESGCGKTVFMSGLAAALREEGFATQATKPIVLGAKQSAQSELSFISSVTHTPMGYHQVFIETSVAPDDTTWLNAISQSRSKSILTFFELPGSCATPIGFDCDSTSLPSWRDSADIAGQLDMPCILVAKHGSDAIEKLVLSAYYLTMKNVYILGLATVETTPGLGQEFEARMKRDDFGMAVFCRTGAPYLGCIKYSPSISVPRVNQGNLIKLTSGGLDVLTVLKALNLTVSV